MLASSHRFQLEKQCVSKLVVFLLFEAAIILIVIIVIIIIVDLPIRIVAKIVDVTEASQACSTTLLSFLLSLRGHCVSLVSLTHSLELSIISLVFILILI